jgi:hypothetical protein
LESAKVASSLDWPELKSAVLKTLHEFTEKELAHDDATLIGMEIC